MNSHFKLQMEKSRETELTRISRELIYLQSNLQKKQKKLKSVLVEKDAEIAARDSKIEELTRRLLERQRQQLPMPPSPAAAAKSGLETPESTNSSSSSSSEEDSGGSGGRVPKFEIKPLRRPSSPKLSIMLPPPLPPPRPPNSGRFRRRLPPSRGHGADEAFLCTPSVS